MSLPEKERWKAASDKEMDSLKKNDAFVLVPATSVQTGHRSIRPRWVYKREADLSYEAPVVVQGLGASPGADCCSTSSPACRFQSICMVLAVAVEYDLECWRMDYNTACLIAELKKEVYVRMAPGYGDFGANGTPMAMRLHQSLCGPCQISNFWWGTVDTHVAEIADSRALSGTLMRTSTKRAAMSTS